MPAKVSANDPPTIPDGLRGEPRIVVKDGWAYAVLADTDIEGHAAWALYLHDCERDGVRPSANWAVMPDKMKPLYRNAARAVIAALPLNEGRKG